MKQNSIIKLKLSTYLLVCGCAFLLECGKPETTLYNDASFSTLQTIRDNKEAELIDYFKELRTLTNAAQSDTLFTHLFEISTDRATPISLAYVREDQLDIHFLENYGEFYDVLWVDTSGFVFYTIRREEDYGTGLFTRKPSTQLASRLRKITAPAFIDFVYYTPSDEPAAFHVVPVFHDSELRGWMVFQQAINRTNHIMTDRHGLGRTGEVYLVNSNGIMLSQSRFTPKSTILQKKIEAESIRMASKAESGNLLITDYRGVRVFSSFTKLDILGTSWYLIVEIDESEVLTAHFSANSELFGARILGRLQHLKSRTVIQPVPSSQTIKVDMGEYGFAPYGQQLHTRGVSTCTGVAVIFPGRFAGLAHVTPIDESYDREHTDMFGGDQRRNLISRLLGRICRYDILPYELDSLQFVVVASHEESCWNIIEQLIGQGILVNQIKLLHNSEALYANVTVQADASTVDVHWFFKDDNKAFVQSSTSVTDLARLVKELSSQPPVGQ